VRRVTVVGLNLLFLAPGETGGMEVHVRGLLPELVRAWPEARFVGFCGRELAGERFEGVELVPLRASSRTRWARTAAEQTLLPAAARRAGVDLLHSPANTMPAVSPGRTVTTIHDVIHARFPETHTGVLARGLAALVKLSIARADRLIAISEATRRDLVELLGADPDRVDVVPNGPGLEVVADPTPEAALRAKLDLGEAPLVLSVSAKRPHKNLARLVEAIAQIDGAVLVVPGYANPHEDELRALARRLGVDERVRFTGWTSDADLEGLYRAARVMAFPSLMEGFGLPVLEAMRRGTPVACSNTSSLPEVAGDAAVLFDPESVDGIRDAVASLLRDEPLREALAAKGYERARQFSWERAARETVAVYRRALGEAGTRLAAR
jgi:glycosyltransferase involved in cell wall biosynthesis